VFEKYPAIAAADYFVSDKITGGIAVNTQSHRVMLLLLAVFLSVSGTVRASYTDMVVFGDSLSDQGNIYLLTSASPFLPLVPPVEYSDGTSFGRFTNGRNYIDYLSASLGLSVTPSLAGGSNYATGGARTDSASLGGFSIGNYGLLDQRDSYFSSLGSAGIDPGALMVVWGGSNDVTDIIDKVNANPSYDPVPDVDKAIADIVDIISSLAAADAKNILVPNVPNLGLVPLITGGGAPVKPRHWPSCLIPIFQMPSTVSPRFIRAPDCSNSMSSACSRMLTPIRLPMALRIQPTPATANLPLPAALPARTRASISPGTDSIQPRQRISFWLNTW
jgi:hypothetical protein